MIPIGDNIVRTGTAFGTYFLIMLNIFIFFIELGQGPNIENFIHTWGTVPAYLEQWKTYPLVLTTLITSIFLHGGWMHLIGNMIFLSVFGKSVEDEMGTRRFVIFYLVCGIAANILQVYFSPGSEVPGVGASGAIAGVLGAYLLYFPGARVFLFVPLLFWFPIIVLPSVIVLGGWFAIQLLNGVASLSTVPTATGDIAYWAHVGGFLAGIILVKPFSRRRRHYIRYYDAWQHGSIN